jgi:diguanylate cyclase (GGDEF)-like protein
VHEAALRREPDDRRFRWVGRLAWRRVSEQSLDAIAGTRAAETRARARPRPALGDRLGRLAISLGFLATAIPLAAVTDTARTPSVWTAALLVATYAIASRVRFDVGAASCLPTEVVLVPMLFVLPLDQVPLWVALALLLGAAPELVSTGSVEAALIPLARSWHALGPVLVLAVAGERGPSWRDLPVYLGALGAQFTFDLGSTALCERHTHGTRIGVLVGRLTWVFLVEAMLAPIGLAIAFAAVANAAAVLLALPLFAFLVLFAGERKARIDHALELSGAYRGTGLLAETYHEILGEESLEKALERIADTISTLIDVDGIRVVTRRRADASAVPLFERSRQPQSGAATVLEVPMVARGRSEGILCVWRDAGERPFDGDERRLVAWFADAAALAFDSARARSALERRAQSDSLTKLLNHRAFHERLRGELVHRRGSGDTTALLLLDIDDFKRVNDVHGHAAGDMVLTTIAGILRSTIRAEDHACRIGGEEFAVIIPSGNESAATALARRIADEVANAEIDPVGTLTVSIGVAEAPRHATGARELAQCADTALLTAKAAGKNRVVAFDGPLVERPAPSGRRDDRPSVVQLELLQSLADKLARLQDVALVGETVVAELQRLVDHDGCRVYVDEGELLIPVAERKRDADSDRPDAVPVRIGEGIPGTAASRREPLLIHDVARCALASEPGPTGIVAESVVAVPLVAGPRLVGAIVVSKLGLSQFDESDVRLLELLAGHAGVAIENARLLETLRDRARQLERDFAGLVAAVASAIQLRAGDDPSGIRGTAELAVAVGRRLGLDTCELRRVELGTLLCDVGAFGIPPSAPIPGGSAQERAIVETHPELGERIVAPIEQLSDVRPVIRHAHERWDGQGHPDGLAGHAIPIESRVVHAVHEYRRLGADSTGEAALAQLYEESGTILDPAVVDAVLTVAGRSLTPAATTMRRRR